MALPRLLSEFIAGLTWPLRGRRVTTALRHEVQQIQFERVRAEGYLKGEVAALAHQLDIVRQTLESGLQAEALRFGFPVIVVSDVGPLVVRSGDLIGEHLRQGQLWDKHLIPIIAESARQGAMAIDAGAHFGTVSAILSDYFDTVHSFEANRSTFKYLISNAAFRRKGKIIPHNIALFDRKTELSLAGPDDQECTLPEADTLEERFERLANSGSLKFSESGCAVNLIRALPLDSFGFTDVGFIKIDCQGADGRVIKGAEATIASCKPIVVFEWEPYLAEEYGVSLDEVKELFGQLDYSVELLFEHNQKQRDYVARPKL
ncbi:MAG: FkbM family methyltransferase [Methylovirgula sp.]